MTRLAKYALPIVLVVLAVVVPFTIPPPPDTEGSVLIEKMTFRVDESIADQVRFDVYGPQGGQPGDSIFMEWVVGAMPGERVPFVRLEVETPPRVTFHPVPNTFGSRGWMVFEEDAPARIHVVVHVKSLGKGS